jgi:FkbM family methyltransferase
VHTYRVARNVYWSVFKPGLQAIVRDDRRRLRRFVPKGSLVFDVGANRGDVTSVLLDLGARVVAVEPNPEMVALIRRRYGVTVEVAAAGRQSGEAVLHLGSDPGHSSLSDEWQTTHPERFDEDRTLRVRVVTLDELIERHGQPAFVKIDVEGFEAEVLGGLSQLVPALSFEFQCVLPEVARSCLERLDDLGAYRYQFVENSRRGATPLTPHDPVDAATVSEMIGGLPQTSYGEIYGCLSPGPSQHS